MGQRILKKRNGNTGSVLIDVMFGVVIIGFVVTSLFLALALANRIAQRAKHVSIAKGVAEEEVEEMRRTDFSSLSIGTSSEAVTELPGGQKTVVLAYYDPPDNDVIQATITITWNERQGTETVTLTTLASQDGI